MRALKRLVDEQVNLGWDVIAEDNAHFAIPAFSAGHPLQRLIDAALEVSIQIAPLRG